MPRGREKRAPASEEIPPKASKHHQVAVNRCDGCRAELRAPSFGTERSDDLLRKTREVRQPRRLAEELTIQLGSAAFTVSLRADRIMRSIYGAAVPSSNRRTRE
jgi:hypothetical protein